MDKNVIIHGDSADVLQTFADDCIDLTITSPPYDDLRTYNGYAFDLCTIVPQLYRVTKPGGVVVWVVNDQTIDGDESGTSFSQALYFKSVGFRLHDTMIYMKSGPAYPSQDKYYQVFEYMFIFSKGKPKTINLLQDRENRWYGEKWSKVRSRRNKKGELKRDVWNNEEGGKYGVRFNIWQYAVGAGNHGDEMAHEHPAPFPEALASDHILSWSNPGDVVLDCFAGSGTTLKTAKALGRSYIGIELNYEYVKLSTRRVLSIPEPLFVTQ